MLVNENSGFFLEGKDNAYFLPVDRIFVSQPSRISQWRIRTPLDPIFRFRIHICQKVPVSEVSAPNGIGAPPIEKSWIGHCRASKPMVCEILEGSNFLFLKCKNLQIASQSSYTTGLMCTKRGCICLTDY